MEWEGGETAGDSGMNACSSYLFTGVSSLPKGQEQQGCFSFIMFLSMCHSLLGCKREVSTVTRDALKENVLSSGQRDRALYTSGTLGAPCGGWT